MISVRHEALSTLLNTVVDEIPDGLGHYNCFESFGDDFQSHGDQTYWPRLAHNGERTRIGVCTRNDESEEPNQNSDRTLMVPIAARTNRCSYLVMLG